MFQDTFDLNILSSNQREFRWENLQSQRGLVDYCLYVFHFTQGRVFSFKANNALTTRAASAARSWKSVY